MGTRHLGPCNRVYSCTRSLHCQNLEGPKLTFRFANLVMLGVLVLAAMSFFQGRAVAQSACAQLGVDCSHGSTSGSSSGSSRSSESDEERAARLEAAAEARAERKAEKEKQQAAKKKAQEEARQKKEAAKKEAEAARQREIEARRQQEIEAERQRQAALEAQRRQAAFDAGKPAAVSALKGDAPLSGSNTTGDSLGLKDDDSATAHKPAWDANITDPQVVKASKRLNSFVPPLPIPKEEVAVTWKQVYLGDGRLLEATDYVISGWEVAGTLSGAPFAGYKLILIGGKTMLAGADGGYLHLVKQEEEYDAANRYLKNPAQAQKFARLVDDMRQNRPVPASADPEMVKAARALIDPKLGRHDVTLTNNATIDNALNNSRIVWDAMTTPEALSAMVRKASIELLSEAAAVKSEKLVKDLAVRKAAFDSMRVEREQAHKMLALETLTPQQREQWTAVVKHADHLSTTIYKTEQVANTYTGKQLGNDIDFAAEVILGKEYKMPDPK